MRTPLTVLDGYVEGLIDGVFAPDPETLTALGSELRRLAEGGGPPSPCGCRHCVRCRPAEAT